MKKIISMALLAVTIACGFNSCKDDSMDGSATYYGTVTDENTALPFEGVEVKVTNGDRIQSSTITNGDGYFSLEVRLGDINEDYYILLGNSRIGTKRVEFPGFGNSRYDLGIITIKGPSAPTVETKEVTNIKSKAATGGGKVTSSGGFAVTRRGVCWSTSQYPTVANDHTEDGTGAGEFFSNISNLQPRTVYYVRAYAENEKGIAYGNQVSFTSASGVPTVQTTLVRVDNKTAVFCEGNVTDQGDSPVTARGICWGTSTPTITSQKTKDGDGTGGFSTSIAVSDVHSQNLYFRAYATNESGTAYGEAIMIDHRNPYKLPIVEEQNIKYIVLPYDLGNFYAGGSYNSSSYFARTACKNLVAYDWNDWEVPTIAVLELLYKKKATIGGFTNQEYWSDSESSSNYYYYIDFSDGRKGYSYYTTYTFGVRPVRKY